MSHGKRIGAVALVVIGLGFHGASLSLAGVTVTGDATLPPPPSDPWFIGNTGVGTALIDGGTAISTDDALIGRFSGSTGTVTVNGAGSKWTIGSFLYIGQFGNGTLNIEAGGQVIDGTVFIGMYGGSTGAATVSGAGSKWTNSETLYVGDNGSGTLTVSSGGLVTTKSLYASLANLHGDGTITVSSGAVLDADLVFDSTHGTTQALTFGSGGTLNLTIDGTANLGAGYQSNGSLTIADGKALTSFFGVLGSQIGSTGTAIVNGTGSSWSINEGLYVGSSGSGSLTVADGGLVTAKNIYASASDLHGNGTINARGGVLDADIVFDATHATATVVPFGSGGTLSITPDGNSNLGAGYKGSGSLRLANGVAITSSYGYIGHRPGSTGTATISASTWTIKSSLRVGNGGNGAMTVEGGGQVISKDGDVGGSSWTGTATVSGAGSKWTNSGNLRMGPSSTLTVSDGGLVLRHA